MPVPSPQHPVGPRSRAALLDPEIRAKGAAASAAAHRTRKIQRLLQSAPPLTEAQIAELRAMLAAHPRLGD